MKGRKGLYCLVWFTLVGVLSLMLLSAEAAERVKLRWQSWHLGEEPWRFVLEDMKKDFEQKNPDIEVVLDRTTYAEKEMVFITQSEAKAAADIVHFSYRPIPMFIEKEYLMDLTPFLKRDLPDYKDIFLELPLSISTKNGRVYALPDDFNPIVLVYNTEMFQEAGLDPRRPPETWLEFLAYCSKLTRDIDGDRKTDQWGYGLIGKREEGMFMRYNPWLWSAGGDYLTPDWKSSVLNKPESIEGVKFYVELYAKYGVVPPGPIEQGCHDVRTQMAHKKVAMKLGSAWTVAILHRLNPKLDAYRVLSMAPVPKGRIKATATWISHRVISVHTKYPEHAWRLYKFVYSPENQLRWFRGAGVISSRKDVRFSPEIQKDRFASVIAAQVPYVKFEPLIPEWPQIGDLMITAVQDCLAGRKTVEKAMLDTHVEVNSILAARK